YDLTGGENSGSNGIMDIHDVIKQKVSTYGTTLTSELSIFYPFNWPGAPTLSSEAGVTTSDTPLGYYMVPWIDKTTMKSYCPTMSHYYSENPIFKAMLD